MLYVDQAIGLFWKRLTLSVVALNGGLVDTVFIFCLASRRFDSKQNCKLLAGFSHACLCTVRIFCVLLVVRTTLVTWPE